jgi:ABC-2 type transport system ATP-binding protein
VSKGQAAAVHARGVRIRYGTIEALRGVDLNVQQGEVFALIGPNGAGKTSLLEILEGYRICSAGDVRVLGVDPALARSSWMPGAGLSWRSRIGVVLQTCRAEPELTVAECVRFYAGLYPNPRRVAEVLELVGLESQARMRCGRLSGGQLRRLDVALALVGQPALVFLDEPTTGFDPAARRDAWEMIRGLRTLGVTLILTTHYLDEAEALADRVAIIAGGRIVADGTPETLGGRDRAPSVVTFRVAPDLWPTLPTPLLEAAQPLDTRGLARIHADDPLALLGALDRWAVATSNRVDGLSVTRPTLEDVYLELTGERGDQ